MVQNSWIVCYEWGKVNGEGIEFMNFDTDSSSTICCVHLFHIIGRQIEFWKDKKLGLSISSGPLKSNTIYYTFGST